MNNPLSQGQSWRGWSTYGVLRVGVKSLETLDTSTVSGSLLILKREIFLKVQMISLEMCFLNVHIVAD